MQGIAHGHDDRRRVGLGRERGQQQIELGEGVIAEPVESWIVLHVLSIPGDADPRGKMSVKNTR